MLKDILKILENDARTTPKQIAAMTGTAQTEVTKLIKKAQDDRVILKYKAIVNWEKAENEHIYRFPQARSVYLVSGTVDLLVLVAGKNNHEVANFVSQKLSHIDGVKETVTQFILKRYKEDGEIMESAEIIKRQAVVL